PMRTGADVCARTVVAYSPPAKNPRNSRRLIAPPWTRQSIVSVQTRLVKRRRDVRFGSEADICSAKGHVRFTPESDIKCDIIECPLRAESVHGPTRRLMPSLLGAGPPVCRFIVDVNVKGNLVLAPEAANSMLANVGFVAVQKPTFYRKRAQVAEGFANRLSR